MSQPGQPEFSKEAFARFLLGYSLYQKFYTSLPLEKLPTSLEDILPETIYYECKTDKCSRTQPFSSYESRHAEKETATLRREMDEYSSRVSTESLPGGSGWGGSEMQSQVYKPSPYGIYLIRYRCGVCWRSALMWWVQISGDARGMFVQKVGQFPPYDISILRDVEKNLSKDDLRLYKQAHICMGQTYGIGACIYLRRLIENQIDTLLNILLETKQEEGAAENELQLIRNVIEEKMLENKIKLVTQPDPQSGVNLVGRMYDRLSDAIHNRDDEECTHIARNVSELFDEVLVGLKQRQKSQRAYLH